MKNFFRRLKQELCRHNWRVHSKNLKKRECKKCGLVENDPHSTIW